MADYHITDLFRVDPAKGRKKILEALRAERMHKGRAAKRLGCSHSTFLVWLKQFDMLEVVAELAARAEREGWHHTEKGGRPLGQHWTPEERERRAAAQAFREAEGGTKKRRRPNRSRTSATA